MTTLSAAPCAEPATEGSLTCRVMPFDDIPRRTWDRLLARTATPTPFSRWTVHRAWWDAYGVTAHEQYLICHDAATSREPIDHGGDGIVGIVPLMHRHAVEAQDATTSTILRRPARDGCRVRPDAKAVFMAASYHADYTTILCDPSDLDRVTAAAAQELCDEGDDVQPWDVIDLRRLRDDDPARPALQAALAAQGPRSGWLVQAEQEDVCPVVDLPRTDWDGYLATLDKKARHEIRRKIRRAEAVGRITLRMVPLDAVSVDTFIDLHQRRWGDQGLFPATEGGARSRRFLHRLTELEAGDGDDAQLQLSQVLVGDRLIFAGVGFDDGTTCYFYNAGMDPDARDLSPGVTGTAAYIRDRLLAGRRRFDFLRGNESYKYEWGAIDQPVHRIVVTRGETV